MITSITATNFKLFKDRVTFSLGGLTLLTGPNGRGKSSLIQIILLLKQSIDHQNVLEQIILNGTHVRLGTYSSIKNISVSQSAPIEIHITNDASEEYNFNLLPSDSDEMIALLAPSLETPPAFLKNVHFIAADRFGPQVFYKRFSPPRFLTVGVRGENSGNVVFQKRDDLVHDQLYLNQNKSQELIIQLGEWINYILDADNLKINMRDVGNGIIILTFQFGNNEVEFTPFNVGFGYSYILPIVISGLISKPNELLIIENPEAHLHPKAQSKLVEFLAKVSKTNVQIIVESHSEHILNSLRVQIATAELAPQQTSILYFQNIESRPVINKIEVDSDGRIEYWPEGFFDQTRNDLKLLFGVS